MSELRDYQVRGAEFLTRGRAILSDDPGVGKTAQALIAAKKLGVTRLLVVCPKNAIGVWRDEAAKWLNQEVRIYGGPLRKVSTLNGDGIVLTNYALLREVQGHRAWWPLIIYDESHVLRNRKAPTLYLSAKKMQSPYVFFLTGTPIFKGAMDLWPMLATIAPSKFPAYWPFVNRYCFVSNNGFGWKEWGIKDADTFARDISPYMLRRRKQDVLGELPPKVRQRVPLQMTPVQTKHYKELAKTLMTEIAASGKTDSSILMVPSVAVLLIRLRQLLVSPRVLGIDDDGAALEALAENVEDDPTPCLVYTPFKVGIPLIVARLKRAGYETHTVRGGLTSNQIAVAVRSFQTSLKQQKALIATVQMGTSWTATAAQTVYFIGYDWSPQVNGQAEDRMHRLGQVHSTRVLYFVHEGTVDRHILDILDLKTHIASLLLNNKNILDPEALR